MVIRKWSLATSTIAHTTNTNVKDSTRNRCCRAAGVHTAPGQCMRRHPGTPGRGTAHYQAAGGQARVPTCAFDLEAHCCHGSATGTCRHGDGMLQPALKQPGNTLIVATATAVSPVKKLVRDPEGAQSQRMMWFPLASTIDILHTHGDLAALPLRWSAALRTASTLL